MKNQQYPVRLTTDEKAQLYDILNKGIHPAKMVKRVNVLLELDQMARWNRSRKFKPTLDSIAANCGVSATTVHLISKQFNKEGLQATITRKKRETPPNAPIVTGEIEARITALACGEAPKGYSRWTLRLLEQKIVELGIVPHISDSTICRVLKKHRLSLT